jgi:hypothetical protein
MMPVFLCLIVLAMPLAIAALAAWAERRQGSTKADRLNAPAGVADVDDDSTLFR